MIPASVSSQLMLNLIFTSPSISVVDTVKQHITIIIILGIDIITIIKAICRMGIFGFTLYGRKKQYKHKTNQFTHK